MKNYLLFSFPLSLSQDLIKRKGVYMKTAVIYARYSSDSQTEQSIEGQLRVCKDYAQRNEITIVKNIWCCYKNHFTKD